MKADQQELGLGKAMDFLRSLLGMTHALEERSKRMQSELGVTAPQRLMLRVVGRHPGISAGEVASFMEVHASTVTRVLQRLEQRRCVARKSDGEDRRRVQLYLTEGGKRLDEVRSGTAEAAVRRALTRLDPEDIETTKRVLAVVAAELGRKE